MNRKHWLKEIGIAEKSAARGYHEAAVRRLGRLRRAIEHELPNRTLSMWHVALLHQIAAGIHERAGQFPEARMAYLKAATVAFGGAYSSVDLLTNSLWAAELAACSAGAGSREGRIAHIRRVDGRGARFLKLVGDLMNEQLIDSALRPVVFGGRYPAKVALKTSNRRSNATAARPAQRRKGQRA